MARQRPYRTRTPSETIPVQIRCPLIGTTVARQVADREVGVVTGLLFDVSELLKHVPHPVTTEGHHVTLIASSFLTAIHMDERSVIFRGLRRSMPQGGKPILVFDVKTSPNSPKVSFEVAHWEGDTAEQQFEPGAKSKPRTSYWSKLSDTQREEVIAKMRASAKLKWVKRRTPAPA